MKLDLDNLGPLKTKEIIDKITEILGTDRHMVVAVTDEGLVMLTMFHPDQCDAIIKVLSQTKPVEKNFTPKNRFDQDN
jgi:hypothetical protein